MASHPDTVFEVKLKGISLSPAQKKTIETAVRQAAFTEVAKMDFRKPVEIRAIESLHNGPYGIEFVAKPKT
jgi:hypothetical protein